jgi:hypothetical protein
MQPKDSALAIAEPRSPTAGRSLALPTGVAIAIAALAAAAFGPDANWDLRNYHLYAAWAWLAQRGELDVAAAQAQTWFNPVLWVPHWFLFRQLDGTALAAVLGGVHGLCAWPLLRLARHLVPDARDAVLTLLVAAGLLSASFVGQLGTSYGDNLLALLALAGLALATTTTPTPMRGALAGACFGAVAALKLSHAPIALGCCAVLAVLPPERRRTLLAASILGAVGAFVLFAGAWMVVLWQRWGNPVFPMFDTLFPGDWIAPASARDLRFVPDGIGAALSRPFAALVDWRATSDYKLRDARPLLLWIALGVAALRWRALQPSLRALCVGACVAWCAWLPLFGYHRYLVALDLLAPMLLVAVVPGAWRRGACALVVLAVLTTNPPNHERALTDWPAGRPVVEPALELSPDTLVVLAGDEPTAHVLPFLPPFAGAVRIEGNLFGPGRPARRLQARVRSRIDGHAGPLILLFQGDSLHEVVPALSEYGLMGSASACTPLDDALLPAGSAPIQLCRLARDSR